MKRAHLGGQRLGRFLFEPFGLTPARFDMLHTILECARPMSQSELRKRLGVVRSAVSEMVKALMELALVKRYRAADGRTWIVQLTQRGRALVKLAYDRVIESGDATAYVDNVITQNDGDPMGRRYDWTGWFFTIGARLGNDACANRDLYWWDIEDLYAALIRPEDGETWGSIPWMDDKWIAENANAIAID